MIFGTVAGNLGQDAEQKHTQNGDAVVSFSVASSRKVKGEEVTTWVRCAMWGKRGEAVAKYLTKGTSVTVVGELSVREYDDKNGTRRTSVDLNVSDLKLQGGRNAGEARPAPAAAIAKPKQQDLDDAFGPSFDDDVAPF